MEPKYKLKYISIFLSFFTHHWFTKVLKTQEKLLSGSKILSALSSESTIGFTHSKTWRSPVCQEVLDNKVVIGCNKIMKPNGFRHFSDYVCSKKVSLLCFVKFVALVLFQSWKKTI